MGELTNQVIQNWAQRLTPSPFEPDVKSSYLRTAVKSEILTPSHTVSIAPISYKVEVDPFVFFDQFCGIPEVVGRIHQPLFQSVEIKQLLKLSFKGEKEVAFKTKGNIEYGQNDDDDAKDCTKLFVTLAVVSSALCAILGECYASQKLKDKQKLMWYIHASLSRYLFMVFNAACKEKILIAGVNAVQPPAANGQGGAGPPAAAIQPIPNQHPGADLALAPENGMANQPEGEPDPPLVLVQNRQDAADVAPDLFPAGLMENNIANDEVAAVNDAENELHEIRIEAVIAVDLAPAPAK